MPPLHNAHPSGCDAQFNTTTSTRGPNKRVEVGSQWVPPLGMLLEEIHARKGDLQVPSLDVVGTIGRVVSQPVFRRSDGDSLSPGMVWGTPKNNVLRCLE